MQIDMHYYGTYAMAITAGINREAAHIIASSAQFVDDCSSKEQIKFMDAGQIDSQATAHHTFDTKNIDHDDQRQVWVPFHFLPGNEGDEFTERLKCRKNSLIAQEMVETALGSLGNGEAVYRLGITAHVYADTFAHYGFSGVGSRRNKVDNDSIEFGELDPDIKDYIVGKAEGFAAKFNDALDLFSNIKSWGAETFSGALGHGAVATYPDRPYLSWKFDYEYPEIVSSGDRNNPETFLEGCQELHAMFVRAIDNAPEVGGGHHVPFEKIKDAVSEILAFQGKCDDRSAKWVEAATVGKLGQVFEIPEYLGGQWLNEIESLKDSEDSRTALTAPVYRFFKTASAHRQYVLRDLLPKHQLVVA